jgi:hypothetical protein
MAQAIVDDGFKVNDVPTTLKEFQTETQKPDELWVARLTPLAVGQSFTINRPEGESVRQFKKRINRAGMAPPNFKTLEWKSKDTNLPEGVEPTHFVVKIRALDLKAKAEHEAKQSQNGQNGTQEASEPPNIDVSATDTNENENAPQARVRGR